MTVPENGNIVCVLTNNQHPPKLSFLSKMSISSFPVTAFANTIDTFGSAIVKDCNTILDNYKNYPNSCHASNAKFLLDRIRTEDIYTYESNEQLWNTWLWNRWEISQALDYILRNNYSVQGRSDNEAVDGPASLAYCAHVKDAFTAEMHSLLHKPYEAVKEYAKAHGYTVYKTYSEPAELQTDPLMNVKSNRLEVKVYRGLNIHEEFVQQVDCYRHDNHVAIAQI